MARSKVKDRVARQVRRPRAKEKAIRIKDNVLEVQPVPAMGYPLGEGRLQDKGTLNDPLRRAMKGLPPVGATQLASVDFSRVEQRMMGYAAAAVEGHCPIYLTPERAEELITLSVQRGVTVDALLGVALANIKASRRTLCLGDKMPFGKYLGQPVESVVRCDPRYVEWMARTVESVCLSERAVRLLKEMR